MPVAAPMQLRSRISSAASMSSLDREVPHSSSPDLGQNKNRGAQSARPVGPPRNTPDKANLCKAVQMNGKGKKRRRKPAITAHLGGTRYEIVRIMVEQCGFVITDEDDANCFLLWNDSFVSTDRISELKPYQKINHFPGMGEICRKDALARNIAKMCKIYPTEYQILPKTWIFPSEFGVFQNYARELRKKKKNKTFIVKPANGAMGNGITLYRIAEKIPQNDHTVVQEYIDRPFIVEGYKCDMRIYALVTSCDPLKIFLYNDGLLRMGTEKYVQPTEVNLDHLFMHLTNYSVNKHSDTYEKSGTVDTGSKRSLRYFNQYLRHHDYDISVLWQSITDVIIKTLIVAQPHVLHAYRMCRPGQPAAADSVCFEILGFDIILDRKLRPWLLEINRSPSFATDEKLDYDIKSGVVEDTLKLLNVRASDKRKNIAAQKALTQRRLFRTSKRLEGETYEAEKRKQSVERRKEELKDMLLRIRRDAAREDFENRNSGRFRRIFPPDDKFLREKYAGMLADAFNVFLSGRTTAQQREINKTHTGQLKEEDILDMLAQCEADERTNVTASGGLTGRSVSGPKVMQIMRRGNRLMGFGGFACKAVVMMDDVSAYFDAQTNILQLNNNPLSSMPTLVKLPTDCDFDDDDDEDREQAENDPCFRPPSTARHVQPSRSSGQQARPLSGSASMHSHRVSGRTTGKRLRSLRGAPSANDLCLQEDLTEKDKEDELTKGTLLALNDMKIKFPGKSDTEAEYILDKLNENWKYHKPRIASYWLVKLDSIKRRKVVDIVRSNVRAVIQKAWRCPDVDTLHLYRVFSRVFNRLLWSHGQGLWNCFQSSGNSWETIFNKSSDHITPFEMACCRRIVQLCRDCLLIVYQFAAEAKNAQHPATHDGATAPYMHKVPTVDRPSGWSPPGQLMSQRMSRLYQNRSHSISSLSGPS